MQAAPVSVNASELYQYVYCQEHHQSITIRMYYGRSTNECLKNMKKKILYFNELSSNRVTDQRKESN